MRRFRALTLAALGLTLSGHPLCQAQSYSVTDGITVPSLSVSYDDDVSAPADESGCTEPECCECEEACEECPCYLFGPDEAFSLFSGDNCHGITAGGWLPQQADALIGRPE